MPALNNHASDAPASARTRLSLSASPSSMSLSPSLRRALSSSLPRCLSKQVRTRGRVIVAPPRVGSVWSVRCPP